MVTTVGLANAANSYIQQCSTSGTINYVKSHVAHTLIIAAIGVVTACKHTAAAITAMVYTCPGNTNSWTSHLGIATQALSLVVTEPLSRVKSNPKELKASIDGAVKLANSTQKKSLARRFFQAGNTRIHKRIPFVTPFSLAAAATVVGVVYRRPLDFRYKCGIEFANNNKLYNEAMQDYKSYRNEPDYSSEVSSNAILRICSFSESMYAKYNLCMSNQLIPSSTPSHSFLPETIEQCVQAMPKDDRPGSKFIQSCAELDTEPEVGHFLKFNQMFQALSSCNDINQELKTYKTKLDPEGATTELCKLVREKLITCATRAHNYLFTHVIGHCKPVTTNHEN